MIIRRILGPDCVIYPTTIVKLLLCDDMIKSFINTFKNMKNNNSDYVQKLIDNTLDEEQKNSKKMRILSKILDNKEYMTINNYLINKPNNIEGPIVNGREILFYNITENLLLAFTYPALHKIDDNISGESYVKKIKGYVYDNFSIDLWDQLFNKSEATLDFDEVTKYNFLTTRYSDDKSKVIRLRKQYNTYIWDLEKLKVNNTQPVE